MTTAPQKSPAARSSSMAVLVSGAVGAGVSPDRVGGAVGDG